MTQLGGIGVAARRWSPLLVMMVRLRTIHRSSLRGRGVTRKGRNGARSAEWRTPPQAGLKPRWGRSAQALLDALGMGVVERGHAE